MEAAKRQRFNRWSVMSNHEINRYDAIPPHIIKALTLCANGSTWADAAAAVGIKGPCLRRWYKDRRPEEFIETLAREDLNVANNLLTSAAPRLADELIQIALDQKVRPTQERKQLVKASRFSGKMFSSRSNGNNYGRFARRCNPSKTAASRPLMFNSAM
ncbi:hypothetical protein [Synechococcus sp. KORDI-52]|uniref:hypothetical protein n=1 Tax=Synechococcus sp. KORDI-52 TaxID=585425 RepID=UPI0020A6618A|nr:hypothetical protein [Synechococcus sp. KORDI-52]